MIEHSIIIPRVDLQKKIDAHRSSFYELLPYFIENYSNFKPIPYIYSAELNEQTDAAFKALKDMFIASCAPHEEKEKGYDYHFESSPLFPHETLLVNRTCYYDNLIDKKTLERWFTTKGRPLGRMMKEVLISISKDAKIEVPVIFLFMMTLVSRFIAIKQNFDDTNLGKVSFERKDVFFSNFFYFFLELLLNDFINEVKDPELKDKLLLPLFSPMTFSQIKPAFFRNPFNYWGLGKDFWQKLDEIDAYSQFSHDKAIPQSVVNNRDIVSEGIRIEYWLMLRKTLFDFMGTYFGFDPFPKKIAAIVYNTTLFFNFLNDTGLRNETLKIEKDSIFKTNKDFTGPYHSFREKIDLIIKEYQSLSNTAYFERVFGRYLTFKSQEAFVGYSRSLMQVLKDRRKDPGIDIKKEYEDGKLYYFSPEKKKVINTGSASETAALFIDIRDFTNKTYVLKEAGIMELIKEKFFGPIMWYAAAKKATGDFVLINIVGDAIIFSGPIDDIVGLAMEVKKYSVEYRQGINILVTDESKRELMALDMGIFITYGKTPGMFSFSSGFGEHVIALGDIINEASRGASRDMNALRRLQYLLKNDQRKKGNENIQLPFNLYIFEGMNINIPPTLEAQLLAITDEKERRSAIESFFKQSQIDTELDQEVKDSIWSQQKYLYNVGVGFSHEAFMAFVNNQKMFSDIKTVRIEIQKLPVEIRNKYFFKDSHIDIVVVNNKSSKQTMLFRREGMILFKGLERETQVWELLTDDLDIYADILALAR